VQDFRFHDIRHDVGTKALRKSGNMKLVQRVLNHANIGTTAKYAHVLDDQVGDVLEQLAESRKKSQKNDSEAA
jgi:site-specific recombinase XerD